MRMALVGLWVLMIFCFLASEAEADVSQLDAAVDQRAAEGIATQQPKHRSKGKKMASPAKKKKRRRGAELLPEASARSVSKVFRINGDMYVRRSLFVRNRLKLMSKGFATTLNGNHGLFVDATSDNQNYGGVFKNLGNGDVRLAHSNGLMVDSHTKAKSGFNARFRNQGSSQVLLAKQSGAALVASTFKGTDWAGQFNRVGKATIKLAGPDGTGIHSLTKGGRYSAKFEATVKNRAKPVVTLATADGVGINSAVYGPKHHSWSGHFVANRRIKVSLAHTSGRALRAVTRGKKVWNSVFSHNTVKVRVGNHDGQAIKSYTSGSGKSKVWNAYFGNQGKSVVRMAHSGGTGLAAWTFSGRKWNAIFGHGKPAVSMVKIGHSSGTGIASVTNKGVAYNALFTNQGSNMVKIAGPKGQGIFSETTRGRTFNVHVRNKGLVDVKLAGPQGEGIFVKMSKGTGAAGRFQTSKQSVVEMGKGGGQGIYSVTGNAYSAKWNTVIQHGVGKKEFTKLRLGGEKGFAIYSKTLCQQHATWNSVFYNAAEGKPTVKLSHSSGQAIHSHTAGASKVYNAHFSNDKYASVSLAHSQGRAIHAHTMKPNTYNARFGNSKASRVYIGHGDGLAIFSRTYTGKVNARFLNQGKSEVQLAHNTGLALYASNSDKSRAFVGHFESKSARKTPNASVKLAHANGLGIWATSNSKSGAAAKFSHGKNVNIRLGTGRGRTLDSRVKNGEAFSAKFQAGMRQQGAKRHYNVVVSLSKPSGEGIRSVSSGHGMVWNAQVEHRGAARVRLAHGSGQGIESSTFKGSKANAVFAYEGQSKVALGSKEGLGILSTSQGGRKFNSVFSHRGNTVVKLAGPTGTALRSTRYQGANWNAIFEDKSPKGRKGVLRVVHADGTVIRSSSQGGTHFNAEFRHDKKSYVKVAHGSGLAIDSVTQYSPNNGVASPPPPGWTPPPPPPVFKPKKMKRHRRTRRQPKKKTKKTKKEPQKKQQKKKKRGEEDGAEELDDTSLLQVQQGRRGRDEPRRSQSKPRGRYNARFTHMGRSSLHIAHSSGTVLQARSLAGSGSAATFEKGHGRQYQRVTLGHKSGMPLMVETASRRSWVSRFMGPRSTVYLAGADALIYAHTKQGVTPQNAKKYIATFRNSVSNAFRIRNDGRVEVGAKRKGYLYVSGNAYIAGSLKTIHKGKKVNMMEELDRVKEENSAMKRMLSEMQAQNAALLQRMSALETQK